ncbi:tRNA pseudouridine(55) synthase TruB [Campylobacter sp. 19-13652]|uniref:tRNA pseudouridine(55) synthase TruB n=1 Tax=Campylobacter sp. 19-13652 TaxID=2840180 RepID=UPI001C751F3A|nr:tRNA pseudouridine(55) synthase TruB [Campylobacter sp. 19-13652]BCX79334.1 tRNA pseudouridine synthase B [Campylobacter sp. 19-13652]
MNALFVANKPSGTSSNKFLSQIKRKYGVKSAGYSGTLDPFASGALIVGIGSYTRLFRYLELSPKVYEAVMWLGAISESGDNENISSVSLISPLNLNQIKAAASELLGEIEYVPPKYSAKHVNGKRAYELARSGEEFELAPAKMRVFEFDITGYSHPFLSFRASVSEGGYIRSLAQILAKKLDVNATLSALKRLSEGRFFYDNEKPLCIPDSLNLAQNEYLGDKSDIMLGKKLACDKFKNTNDGVYLVEFEEFFSIIEIKNAVVAYRLNKVEKC